MAKARQPDDSYQRTPSNGHTNQSSTLHVVSRLAMLTSISKCRRRLCQWQWSERDHPRTGAIPFDLYVCVRVDAQNALNVLVCVRQPKCVDVNVSRSLYRENGAQAIPGFTTLMQTNDSTPFFTASRSILCLCAACVLNVRWIQRTADIVYSVRHKFWISRKFVMEILKIKMLSILISSFYSIEIYFIRMFLLSLIFHLDTWFAWMRTFEL